MIQTDYPAPIVQKGLPLYDSVFFYGDLAYEKPHEKKEEVVVVLAHSG